MSIYRTDLAYIHDAGFRWFARGAAPGLLELLRRGGVDGRLVVDLGCGSGIWAAELIGAGYEVLGIDASPAMIRLARERAPAARFRVGSHFDVALPQCAAVTAIGESLSYRSGRGDHRGRLAALFGRVHAALESGGLFLFDLAEPGLAPEGEVVKSHWRGEDWAVLTEVSEDARRRLARRRITTFRKSGRGYRRCEEVHELRLYPRAEVLDRLRAAGFRVRARRRYGGFDLPSGRVAFLARKP